MLLNAGEYALRDALRSSDRIVSHTRQRMNGAYIRTCAKGDAKRAQNADRRDAPAYRDAEQTRTRTR